MTFRTPIRFMVYRHARNKSTKTPGRYRPSTYTKYARMKAPCSDSRYSFITLQTDEHSKGPPMHHVNETRHQHHTSFPALTSSSFSSSDPRSPRTAASSSFNATADDSRKATVPVAHSNCSAAARWSADKRRTLSAAAAPPLDASASDLRRV